MYKNFAKETYHYENCRCDINNVVTMSPYHLNSAQSTDKLANFPSPHT